MAQLGDIIFDCQRPAPLARFWAAVFDGYAVAPYDEAELARLRGIGVNDPEDDPNVLVEPGPAGGPRLFFTQVPEDKVVKNRVHLDLHAADAHAEADRLVGLGATVVADRTRWITMQDPEGNEFCIMK